MGGSVPIISLKLWNELLHNAALLLVGHMESDDARSEKNGVHSLSSIFFLSKRENKSRRKENIHTFQA